MTKTEKPWAAEQAARMSGMRDYPFEKRGRAELARALRKNFPDQATASQAVTRILNELDQCPTVYTIGRYAQAMGLTEPASVRLAKIAGAQDCHQCNNTGWRPVQQYQRVEVPERCDCAFGGALRTADLNRFAAERLGETIKALRERGQRCEKCNEVGLVTISRVIETEGVEPCSCALGEILAGKKPPIKTEGLRQGNLL